VPVSPIPSRSSPTARHRRNVVPPIVPCAPVQLLATTAPSARCTTSRPTLQNNGWGANPSAPVVGSAAHVNRIDISTGFQPSSASRPCGAVRRGSRYCRGAPSSHTASAPGPATQGGGRDSVCPAIRRVAWASLRAAREVGSDPLVDDGPGGGRFLSGTDRDLRWLRTKARSHPQPSMGNLHNLSLFLSLVSTSRAGRWGPAPGLRRRTARPLL
jgi:hypothetical protein